VSTLSGRQKGMLLDALVAAFPSYKKLEILLDLQLDPSRKLASIAANGPLPEVVYDVVSAAESEGWVRQLVTGACLGNAGNPELRALVAEGQLDRVLAVRSLVEERSGPARDVLPYGRVLDDVPGPTLERLVNTALGFENPAVWAARLLEHAARVCRVDVVSAQHTETGTGFLVGPDLVLTCHHVLADVLDRGTPPSGVSFRFDFRVTPDEKVDSGITYGLADEWLLSSSRPSQVDRERHPTAPPAPDELDYALVRLDGDPGRQPAHGQDQRGWLDLRAEPPTVRLGLPLLILQHPRGNPIKLALDTAGVLGVNANETRITYGVNTLPGSSGSPCLSLGLRLVALHHAASAEFGQRNAGIPISAVVAHAAAAGAL
jgi:hypothetical protein